MGLKYKRNLTSVAEWKLALKNLERSRQEIREEPHLTVFFYLLRPNPEGLLGCLMPNFAFFKKKKKNCYLFTFGCIRPLLWRTAFCPVAACRLLS